MKIFHTFVHEASRDGRLVALETRDALASSSGHYVDEMLLEGVSVKFINGDGATELGRSRTFLKSAMCETSDVHPSLLQRSAEEMYLGYG